MIKCMHTSKSRPIKTKVVFMSSCSLETPSFILFFFKSTALFAWLFAQSDIGRVSFMRAQIIGVVKWF